MPDLSHPVSSPSIAPWLLNAVEPHPALLGPAPIPAQFRTATLAGIQNKGLHRLVSQYGRDFWQAASRGLAPLLVGPPGVYKSFSAAVLAKQIHEKACVRTAWCDVPVTLFQLERKRFQSATDELIHHWKETPWLVIDDFAMVAIGSWQHGVLCEIAMHRFSQGRPTCWTGNVQLSRGKADALVEVVGAQLARRLMEGSDGYRLAVTV